MNPRDEREYRGPHDHPELFRAPAVLLFASIPKLRPPDQLLTPDEQHDNARFVASAAPAALRECVAQLCRFVFAHDDLTLVFGAHPAISPMVLAAAQAAPVRERRKRVVIFQSEHFRGRLPDDTLRLANWESGTLLWTPEVQVAGPPIRTKRVSLTRMRELMVTVPNLAFAIAAGGMEGVIEEALLWEAHHPDLPLFAIPSTGSAAEQLYREDPARRSQGIDRDLATSRAYPKLLRALFHAAGM